MTKIALILNNKAGNRNSTKSDITRMLQARGNSEFVIINFDPQNLREQIQKLSREGYGTITAVGGDGTVSAIAGTIVGLGLPLKLGILPFGTLNHFAKDLGIPLKLEEAVDILLKGKSALIDIGKVNELYFINNSSVGLYADIVKIRQGQKGGLRKILNLLPAAFVALRSGHPVTAQFESRGTTVTKTVSFVFVGNNKYEYGGVRIGERKRLDEGILTLSLVKNVSKLRLLILALKLLAGTAMHDKNFSVLGLQKFILSSPKSWMDVSYDGEVSRIKPPLSYQIIPQALSVIIP